jgi:hypothetical protein
VRWAINAALLIAGCAAAYALLAYVVLPALWTHHERQPDLAGRPMTTNTAQGIPGDPLNVSLVGSEDEVVAALGRAGWKPADAITLKSSARIAESVLLHQPDPNAPVSTLFYEGRRQDLAFEKPEGGSADKRHHVRFWHVLDKGAEGRPVWLGAATFDASVGLSHYTGQITHNISPDVDAERDGLIFDLNEAGALAQIYQVTGSGPTLLGRNGEGDRYITDGEMTVGVLRTGELAGAVPAAILPNPPAVEIKNSAISAIKAVVVGEE